MSDTGPSELSRLVKDEEAFRLYVVSKLATIVANQEAHEREDTRRFDEGNARMAAIEANAKGVSSAVETEKDSNRYTLREIVGGFIVLCGALGGFITFLYWIISNAGKGAP